MRKASDLEIETPITSMIDIVFLLIIFFVVTSTIQKEAIDRDLQLAKSHYTDPADLEGSKVIINVRSGPSISVGMQRLDLHNLKIMLRKLKNKETPIVIRADGGMTYREVDLVMAAVGESGMSRIRLAASAEY